jgi:hypothetical protein
MRSTRPRNSRNRISLFLFLFLFLHFVLLQLKDLVKPHRPSDRLLTLPESGPDLSFLFLFTFRFVSSLDQKTRSKSQHPSDQSLILPNWTWLDPDYSQLSHLSIFPFRTFSFCQISTTTSPFFFLAATQRARASEFPQETRRQHTHFSYLSKTSRHNHLLHLAKTPECLVRTSKPTISSSSNFYFIISKYLAQTKEIERAEFNYKTNCTLLFLDLP